MQDVFKEICVCPGRDVLKEASCSDQRTAGNASIGEDTLSLRDNVRQIQNCPRYTLVPSENTGQEGSVAATDVDDVSEATEVIGRQKRPNAPDSVFAHRSIKYRGFLRMLGSKSPCVLAVNVSKRVLTS